MSNTPHPLNRIKQFLERFVVYPSKHELVAHAAWIVHTHLMHEWDTTPRLAALSNEPASGKSRLLEVTAPLVARPVEAVNASPAYLFRRAASEDGLPTILHDEIDTVFGPKARENEEVRGFLNAGYRRNAKFGRCVNNKSGPIKTEDIPAYCAVAVAGLGNLPDTILSRSVIIRMKRRAPGEKVETFRLKLVQHEADEIKSSIESWCAEQDNLLEKMLPLPDQIKDRDADVWETLIAIGDRADEEWSTAIRDSAVTLVTQLKDTPASIGITLLTDIRDVFKELDLESIHSHDLLLHLNAQVELIWGDLDGKPLDERRLARILRNYLVKPTTVRCAGKTLKGYKRVDFRDAFERYLTPTPQL